jgi:hypothetical protein
MFSALALIMSCSDAESLKPSTAPVITAIDREAVVIGETLNFRGERLLSDDEGTVKLNFIGTFVTDDGARLPVDTTITTLYDGESDGAQFLRWSRVGPFQHPFMKGEQVKTGSFEGQVYPININAEGEATYGEPHEMSLKLLPSISIELWEPVVADCGAPALRVFPGVPYRMAVKVGGVSATRFIYEFNQINGDEGITTFDHDFGEGQVTSEDEVGASSEIIVFNPIPEDF